MNKAQLISKLKAWATDEDVSLIEIHVSHGGSLLMLGLRDETDDIDLTVSKRVWDRLIDAGHQVQRIPPSATYPEVNLISVTDDIDVHLIDPSQGVSLDVFDGVWYRDARNTLADKMRLNRPKDQKDIEALKKLIAD